MKRTTTNRRAVISSIVGGVLAALGMRNGAYANGYVDAIYDAAARHGASGDWMVSVMWCESGGNPNAVGRRLNINGTRDIGLFQINELTWEWWINESGFIGFDIWNPWDQIEMAAWAFAAGYACHWVCAGC